MDTNSDNVEAHSLRLADVTADRPTRIESLRALLRCKPTGPVRAALVRAAALSCNGPVLAQIVRAIGLLGDRAGLADLAPFLRSQNRTVATNAAKAVIDLDAAQAVSIVGAVILEAPPGVAWPVALILARRLDRSGPEFFLPLVFSPRSRDRLSALVYLRTRPPAESVPILLEMLGRERDPGVRVQVGRLLGRRVAKDEAHLLEGVRQELLGRVTEIEGIIASLRLVLDPTWTGQDVADGAAVEQAPPSPVMPVKSGPPAPAPRPAAPRPPPPAGSAGPARRGTGRGRIVEPVPEMTEVAGIPLRRTPFLQKMRVLGPFISVALAGLVVTLMVLRGSPGDVATPGAPRRVVPPSKAGVMRVLNLEGTARRETASGTGRPLQPGDDVGSAESVATGEKSTITLVAAGGSTLWLGSESKIQIVDPTDAGVTSGATLAFRDPQGEVLLDFRTSTTIEVTTDRGLMTPRSASLRFTETAAGSIATLLAGAGSFSPTSGPIQPLSRQVPLLVRSGFRKPDRAAGL